MRLPERYTRWWLLVLLMATTGVLSTSAPALGHAKFQSSMPARAAMVEEAPDRIEITFTEPPAGGAVAEVLDGCERDVALDTTATNQVLGITLAQGQPGRWRVRYSLVSAVDGHPTEGGFGFRVSGRPDCELAARDDASPPGPAGDGPTTPIRWLLLVGAVLIVVAYIVRVASR